MRQSRVCDLSLLLFSVVHLFSSCMSFLQHPSHQQHHRHGYFIQYNDYYQMSTSKETTLHPFLSLIVSHHHQQQKVIPFSPLNESASTRDQQTPTQVMTPPLQESTNSSPSSSPNNPLTIDEPTTTTTPPPQSLSAQSLDGRLLCASLCSYEISSPSQPNYFRGVGYRPATTVKRISRGTNSVLIGQSYDGITIAFRGTVSTSPLDWLQNAALFLSTVEFGEKEGSSTSSSALTMGKIHTGFYRAAQSLWKPLKNILREMMEENERNGWKNNVYITGHSKGGAMASVAAVLMKRDNSLPDPTYVCTFASAKVGNSEFRDVYNKIINQTSYEAHLDLIPYLPPSTSFMEHMDKNMTDMIDSILWSETSSSKKDKYTWDYQTVGKRKYISENGQITDDITKDLEESRIRAIEMRGVLAISDFRSAHCPSCFREGECDGLYLKAVASDIICKTDDDQSINGSSDVNDSSSNSNGASDNLEQNMNGDENIDLMMNKNETAFG